MEGLQHLVILCCYGGVPFIDYGDRSHDFRHESTNVLDPTDWIAVDSSGSLLNATLHPDLLSNNSSLTQLIPLDFDTPLDRCDLYNLTFSSSADQNLYELGHGVLSCRCPRRRFGSSCHLKQPPSFPTNSVANVAAALLHMDNGEFGGGTSFNVVILCFMCLVILMTALFMMMRGCFCDCFGGLKNPFSTIEHRQPLDPDAINRCLEAVNAHEQNEKNRYGVEARHPLIPSISEGCAPYDSPVLPAGHYQIVRPPRNCSPPPSYKSEHGSVEYLHNTKL